MNYLFRNTACIMNCLTLTIATWAGELYNAPTGKHNNPGTQAAPIKNRAVARDAARRLAGR